MKLFAPLIAVLALVAGCNRDSGEIADPTDSLPRTVTVTLDGDVAWANTGILLIPNQRIRIEPDARAIDDALGHPEADFLAPIPTSGSLGLIARMGEKGLPVAVGEEVELQASSASWGEYLFIGRNGKPSDFATAMTSDSTEDVTAVSKTVLLPIEVLIHLDKTTSPAPLAPVTGFFTSNVSPTFDWDDVEDSFKYVFELSRFPDFRDQVLSIEPTGSSVSLAALSSDSQTPTIPGQTTPAATLPDGLYYWRVRSQMNVGRTIAPVFKWTDYSVVNWFGVETRGRLPAPRILAPLTDSRYAPGESILLEFTQTTDASGLFWRYKAYKVACGTIVDPANLQPEKVSAWYVFLKDFDSNFIGELPVKYGSAVLQGLETGQYLYQIQAVDGADGRTLNTGRGNTTAVSFSVGCQN